MADKPPVYLTPAELCARWKVDARTLDKLGLPWFIVTDRIRRLSLEFIVEYERKQRLGNWTTTRPA